MVKYLLLAVIITASSTAVFSQDKLTMKGRIAVSHDGNAGDEDDIRALAIEWGMMAAFGVQKRFVHVEHSIFGRKDPKCDRWGDRMEESAKGCEVFPHFDCSVVFDYWEEEEACNANFKKVAEASSENDRLYFCVAGPMECPFRDISHVAKDKRKFITVISHSTVNQTMWSCHDENRRWTDMKKEYAPDGVKFIEIDDQNGNLGGGRSWGWLNNMPENEDWPAAAGKWILSRVGRGNGDCSDAGMVWYALTGNQNAQDDDLERHFKDPLPPEDKVNLKYAAPGAAAIFSNPVTVTFSQNNGVLQVTANGIQNDGSMSMYSLLNEKVAETPMASGRAQFTVEKTPPGVYFLNIKSKGHNVTKEIVVK